MRPGRLVRRRRSTQTTLSISARRAASRLAVPSLKPSRLRTVSLPSFLTVCGGRKPSLLPAQRQQIRRVLEDVAQRVDVGLGRVGAELQQQVAVAELARRARRWGTAAMATRCFGRSFCKPKRSSNSDAPKPTVMVRLSGNTFGPSRPESGGGSLSSRWSRLAALHQEGDAAVSSFISRGQVVPVRASTSKAANSAAAGCGVTMPA